MHTSGLSNQSDLLPDGPQIHDSIHLGAISNAYDPDHKLITRRRTTVQAEAHLARQERSIVKSAESSILAVDFRQAANPMIQAVREAMLQAVRSAGRTFLRFDFSFASGVHASTWIVPFELTLAKKLNAHFGSGGIWWNTPR